MKKILIISVILNIVLLLTSAYFYDDVNHKSDNIKILDVELNNYKSSLNIIGNELIKRPVRFETVCNGIKDNHLPIELMVYSPIKYDSVLHTIYFDYDKQFIIKDIHIEKSNCSKGNGYFIGLMNN